MTGRALVIWVLCACRGVTNDPVAASVADSRRPASDRERDPAQKPADVLAFAGVKPGDRVGDFWPVPPYSTRLLAGVVGPRGHVYAILPAKLAREMPAMQAETIANVAPYGNVDVLVEPLDAFTAPTPLDVVWLGKIYHDLPNTTEMGPIDIAAMNRAIFDALAPGGTYVVIDHAAVPGSGYLDREPDPKKRLHRIDPEVVTSQVTAAGFVLEARSDVLANPADPRDHSVFDTSITGRTDRFVFRFRKPAR